jgi:hypothetical protein
MLLMQVWYLDPLEDPGLQVLINVFPFIMMYSTYSLLSSKSVSQTDTVRVADVLESDNDLEQELPADTLWHVFVWLEEVPTVVAVDVWSGHDVQSAEEAASSLYLPIPHAATFKPAPV